MANPFLSALGINCGDSCNTGVKFFMWRLLHRRTPTFNFFYNMNIGPLPMCSFCELMEESDDHAIWKCRVSRKCWELVSSFAGVQLEGIDSFVEGSWLLMNWQTQMGNQNFKYLMVTCS